MLVQKRHEEYHTSYFLSDIWHLIRNQHKEPFLKPDWPAAMKIDIGYNTN